MLLYSGRSFVGCFNNVFILSPEIALSGRGKSIEDSFIFGLQCCFFFWQNFVICMRLPSILKNIAAKLPPY